MHLSSLFVPLGLSFYTFSAAGYLIDVYNTKYRAETKVLRLLLCISYFPSIVHGTINRFDDLRHEFFGKDKEDVTLWDAGFAAQRILWGMIKKHVVADRAAQMVRYIFGEYERLPWFAVEAGLVLYSVQLYADFAGGIDVALGASELLGVRLKENFRRPCFSTSIAEFWRRWHITLGTWMKDYVFYPLSLSKGMGYLSNAIPNKYLMRCVPASLANIAVFLIVGLRHGSQRHFAVYGLFHGSVIVFSVMAPPLYDKLIAFFYINVKSVSWRVWQIVHTFSLVTLAGLTDDATDIKQSAGMARALFDITNGGK